MQDWSLTVRLNWGPKENWRPVPLLTAEEVQCVVPQINTKKSIGLDGLEGKALKKMLQAMRACAYQTFSSIMKLRTHVRITENIKNDPTTKQRTKGFPSIPSVLLHRVE